MIQILIGPNGYGKTYALQKEYNRLKEENPQRRDLVFLNSELVFSDEMKTTVKDSFFMEYIFEELLDNEEVEKAKKEYEKQIDESIKNNIDIYNCIMDEVLALNQQNRTKQVLDITSSKEHKNLVKINTDDFKNNIGSGQRLFFLLKAILISKKTYIFLDEPENHTHPSLLHNTAGMINQLGKDRNVFIATHSPELLNLLEIDFDNLYIYNDSKFLGPKTIDFENAVKVDDSINIENINSKSKSYYNVDSLKRNILELHKKEFFECLFSKKVYLIEGIGEELFLKKLILSKNKQFEQYSIFHSYGKPHFLPFINIFNQLDIKIVALFDQDKKEDNNNMLINKEIKKCGLYLESVEILEHELGFDGKKNDMLKFLNFLDDYDNYEKYEYLLS